VRLDLFGVSASAEPAEQVVPQLRELRFRAASARLDRLSGLLRACGAVARHAVLLLTVQDHGVVLAVPTSVWHTLH